MSQSTNSQKPTITFIVPALNEEQVITATVDEIIQVSQGRFSEYEMLLINDGSADATGELMQDLARRYHHVRVINNDGNIGLGACYRLGCLLARYEYVMLLCGDGGMPASSLPAIFDKIGAADIVIPYCENLRQIKTSGRYFLSRGYTLLLNLLFGLRLHYYNGLPVHRLELVRSVGNESEGFGFQAEILVKLLMAGCSYVEVGVDGAERTNRSSALRMKNLVNVSRTIVNLVRYSLAKKQRKGDVSIHRQSVRSTRT